MLLPQREMTSMFQYFKSSSHGQRSLKIGFVSPDATTRKQISDVVGKQEGIEFKFLDRKSITAKSILKDVNVLVYDLDTSSEAELLELDRFMGDRPQSVPVVVISTSMDEELVRWLLRLRVADWLRQPMSAGELMSACGRALSQAQAQKSDVKCMAFLGARGGVGTTTLAIHAALALAKQVPGSPSTCLVDLDFNTGAASDYLDLQPGWQVDELMSDPGRLDALMFGGMLGQHKSGIAVLSAQRKYGLATDFPEDVVTQPLEFALQKYTNLVVDVSRSAEKWANNVLQGATQVFVVTEFTVPGLKSGRRLVNELRDRYGDDIQPKVIVNKYQKSLFGSNLSSTEAKELLGTYLAGFIQDDSRLVNEAINRGIPTTEIKKNNHIQRDLAKIIGVKA